MADSVVINENIPKFWFLSNALDEKETGPEISPSQVINDQLHCLL